MSNSVSKQGSVVMKVNSRKYSVYATIVDNLTGNATICPMHISAQVNTPTSLQNGHISVITANQQVRSPIQRQILPKPTVFKHPAPLPLPPSSQQVINSKKPIPPRPHLNLMKSNCGNGIVLQWKMPYNLDVFEDIVSYQLYAYQQTKSPPRTDNWGKVGDVKALELPMAVTLTQFAVGNRYYFAVRAVDGMQRLGQFSEPQTILL